MNTLQISQKDVKSLLISSALLPVTCFILGFYIASSIYSNGSAESYTVAQNFETNTTPNRKHKTEQIKQIAPDAQHHKISSLNKVALRPLFSDVNNIPLSNANYIVQAGLFSKYQNAVRFQLELRFKGVESQISDISRNDKQMYKIIVGSFKLQEKALQFLERMKEKQNLDLYIAHSSKREHLAVAAL